MLWFKNFVGSVVPFAPSTPEMLPKRHSFKTFKLLENNHRLGRLRLSSLQLRGKENYAETDQRKTKVKKIAEQKNILIFDKRSFTLEK
jgi:hypothetical protein